VCQHLQKDNARKIKSATDGIYLMHHTTVPAILVECGFLSNPNEAALLKQDVYRQQLTFAIMTGYWNYCLGM
jgi:N-acetylmuramoyl-L-alanine amidase